MTKNALIWIVAVVMLSGGSVAHAQSLSAPWARPLTPTATPLSDSARRAAIALAKTPPSSQQLTHPSRRKQCAKGLLIGTGSGAALGFGSAVGLLTSSGGSDSAAEIIQGFTSFGAAAGFLVGSVIGCK